MLVLGQRVSKKNQASFPIRHDYARIWRRLEPKDRDRRITLALKRLAEGETLREVATTWSVSAATLCRALIAWAPSEWRAALVAQTLAQAEAIANGERNITRAQERLKLLEWRMKRTLRAGPLESLGQEMIGPCPQCSQPRSVYVRARKRGDASSGAHEAKCFQCEWEGDRRGYLAGLFTDQARKQHRK